MQMDAGLDTGDMLLVEAQPIGPADTSATLHDRLAEQGARLIVQAVDLAVRDELQPVPQPAAGANYAHKIEKTEAALDWAASADVLARRLRAFDPFPGCSTVLGGQPVKVWRGSAVPGAGQPGQVLQAQGDQLVVACGGGALQLHELQLPGGRRIGVADFLQRQPVLLG